MKKFNFRTYNNSWLLFKSAVALLLICFVLLKPIQALIQEMSVDKTEFCMDTDDSESDEKESDEKESEESEETDDEQEDKFSIHSRKVHSTSSKYCFVTSEQNYCNEFHRGVISPPPERG